MTVNRWIAQIDFSNNGSFTDALDDISAYVEVWDIQVGAPKIDPLTLTASAGQATLVLNNSDKRFSPAYTSGPYYGNLVPGRPVRIQITNGTSTWTAFYGYARIFDADSGLYGLRKATLEIVDLIKVLQDVNISIPLQENVNGSVLIRHVINAALLAPASSGKFTLTAAPANNDTISINGTTYTYKTVLSGGSNEILISGILGSAQNSTAALNNSDGAGTNYASNTTRAVGLTASINSPGGYEISNRDSNASLRQTGTVKDRLAEQFQVSGQSSIAQAILYLQKVGTPIGTMTLRIETDSGGQPSGTLADANATGTLAESGLAAAYALATFTFAGSITLQPRVVYWLVLSTSRAASGVDYVQWGADASSPTYAYQNASGGTASIASVWTAESKTFCFYIGELSVTLAAALRGAVGNTYALSDSSAGITVSGATLTGGQDYPLSPVPSIDTGRQTFDIAADQWSGDKTNGLTAIQQVTNSEQGRFWAARDGTLTFKNRDYQFARVAATATLVLNAEPVEVAGSMVLEDVFNTVRITYTPRSTLASGVVAQSKGVISVPGNSGFERWNSFASLPSGSNMVKLPFTDPATGQPMGAKSIVTPLVQGPAFDLQVTDNPTAGVGFDYSGLGYLIVSLAINGNDVEVSFANVASGTLYIQKLQVRGIGIVNYNPNTITQEDAASQASYRKRVLAISLPLPSGQNFAQALAGYLLGRYKNPAYRVRSITFGKQEVINGVNLYSLEIGNVITLTDAQLGISNSRYLITGIRYKRSVGSAGDVTLYVWRLDDVTYGIWDDPVYGLADSTMRAAI